MAESKKDAAPAKAPAGVAKIRVTSGGAHNTAEFKGKVFTRDGEDFKAGEISAEDLAEMDANPSLTVERFNEQGALVTRAGASMRKHKGPRRPVVAKGKEE